jgi:hypothetical protein
MEIEGSVLCLQQFDSGPYTKQMNTVHTLIALLLSIILQNGFPT